MKITKRTQFQNGHPLSLQVLPLFLCFVHGKNEPNLARIFQGEGTACPRPRWVAQATRLSRLATRQPERNEAPYFQPDTLRIASRPRVLRSILHPQSSILWRPRLSLGSPHPDGGLGRAGSETCLRPVATARPAGAPKGRRAVVGAPLGYHLTQLCFGSVWPVDWLRSMMPSSPSTKPLPPFWPVTATSGTMRTLRSPTICMSCMTV